MTEQEAKVFINNAKEQSLEVIEKLRKIKDKAERAKRIGEYYCHLENCEREIEACDVAISALEEIQQYRALGTVKELREAREKQAPKKPIFHITTWNCPRCGGVDLEEVNEFGSTFKKYAHCPDCGQTIDWSNTEQKSEHDNTKERFDDRTRENRRVAESKRIL